MSGGPAAPEPTPVDRLKALLELDPLDRDLFLGDPGPGTGRLFGGMVAAQSVVAAGRTVEEGRSLHSLHAYFLRPGSHDGPIRFVVHRIRDGRSFTTRRVVAHQAGEAIFNLSSSFVAPEEGIAHQADTPEAEGPEGLPTWEEVRARQTGEPPRPATDAIEVRVAREDAPGDARRRPRHVWMRPRGVVGEESLLHAALLVYASDRTLLSTVAHRHGLLPGQRMGASLDHAMWLHRPARFDDWVLTVSESPVAHAARGLILAGMYDRGGVRIASIAQEGLIRLRRGSVA